MSLTHIINMPVTGQLPAGPHASAVYTVESPQGPLVFKVYKTVNDGAAREYATATSAKTTPSLDVPSLATPAGVGHIEGEGMWVAYKKVDGPLLSEIASTLTPAEGVELLLALTDAVIALHGTGTFHHNIGPHQVRVVDGVPTLLDVGYFWTDSSVRPTTAAQDIKGLISVAQILPLTATVQSAATRLKPSVASYRDALMKAKVRDEIFTPEKHQAPAGGLPTSAAPAPAPAPAPTSSFSAPAPAQAPAAITEPVETEPAVTEQEAPAPAVEQPTPPAEAVAPAEAPTPEVGVGEGALAPEHQPEPTELAEEESALAEETPATSTEPIESTEDPVPVEMQETAPTPAPAAVEPAPAEAPAPVVEQPAPVEPIEADLPEEEPPAPAQDAPTPPAEAPVKAPEIHSAPESNLPTREPSTEPEETPAPVKTPAKKLRRHKAASTQKAPKPERPAGKINRRTALTAGGVIAAALLAGGGYLAYQKTGAGAGANGLTDKLTTATGETKSGIDGYSTTTLYTVPISEEAKVFAAEAAIAIQNGTSLDLHSVSDGTKIRTIEVPDGIQSIRETRIGDDAALVWKTGAKIVAYTQSMGKDGSLITLEKSADTKLLDAGQRPMLLDGAKVFEITSGGEKEYATVSGSTPIAIDKEGLISGTADGLVTISTADGTPVRTLELTAPAEGLSLHQWVYAGNGLAATIWSADPLATDAKTPAHLTIHRLADGAVASDVQMSLGAAQEGTWITGQASIEASYGVLIFNVARGELVSELPSGWLPVRIKGSHVIAEDATGARQVFSGSNPGISFNGAILAQVTYGLIIQKGNAILCYPSSLS